MCCVLRFVGNVSFQSLLICERNRLDGVRGMTSSLARYYFRIPNSIIIGISESRLLL